MAGVIAAGNEKSKSQVHIPIEFRYIHFHTNTLRKVMNLRAMD